MDILRTPDASFEGLLDYPFAPHYAEVPSGDGGTLRIHYVDEGPRGAHETVLLLHGEPSWSYLYRHMIPGLVAKGYRVIAPDLVGFGKSDKPASRSDYTYAAHVAWLDHLVVTTLNLSRVTLFCQDWGGLLGLRLVAAHPERFARVITANTGLPTGDGTPTEGFLNWQKLSQEVPEFPVGIIINLGTVRELAPEEIAAYDAPFPDESYKEGARQFPLLVPSTVDDPERQAQLEAWTVLKAFTKPWLVAFSDKDPVTKGTEHVFLRDVPGTADQAHTTIEGGGHFLQEDASERLVAVISDCIAANPA